jgi:hypothetical protein
MLTSASEIKRVVVEHFKNQFSARGVRPIPANMRFKCIDSESKEDMVREFSE